ncbi:hypothetical protein PIB30_094652 [Stylosanthes scabra]|uniref:Uncharacterized protein n=1 Tax=Stylosanthes scabra TaxID=79078 RepID=A0ABU6SWR0_9FABA|nr:hypothetical protein [Stylosanthes scabra]
MDETRANFRNQESAIRNLEIQVGQIAKQLNKRPPNTFPSDTILNPKEECKAIRIIEMEETPKVQVEVPTEKPEIIAETKNKEAVHHSPQSSKKHRRSSSKFLEVLACLEKLGIKEMKPTKVILQMADKSVRHQAQNLQKEVGRQLGTTLKTKNQLRIFVPHLPNRKKKQTSHLFQPRKRRRRRASSLHAKATIPTKCSSIHTQLASSSSKKIQKKMKTENELRTKRKLKKGSLQIKKRNLEAKQSKAPRICVDEHAYACCSYPNPRLSQPTTLRRGNLLDQSHAYA